MPLPSSKTIFSYNIPLKFQRECTHLTSLEPRIPGTVSGITTVTFFGGANWQSLILELPAAILSDK